MRSFFQRGHFLSLFPQFIKTPMLLIILITFSLSLATLVYYFQIQPIIPLFYTLPQQEEHLVAKEWLFLFPILSTLITFIHAAIILRVQAYERVLLTMFTWGTLVIQVLLLLAFARIIFIIT